MQGTIDKKEKKFIILTIRDKWKRKIFFLISANKKKEERERERKNFYMRGVEPEEKKMLEINHNLFKVKWKLML